MREGTVYAGATACMAARIGRPKPLQAMLQKYRTDDEHYMLGVKLERTNGAPRGGGVKRHREKA